MSDGGVGEGDRGRCEVIAQGVVAGELHQVRVALGEGDELGERVLLNVVAGEYAKPILGQKP
jgi:hypothetical protein